MPQLHRSERALKLLTDAARQKYICRSCRAQIRAFHTTYPTYAPRSDRPLLQRLREGIFGTTETTPAEQKREEASRERTKELGKSFDYGRPLERRKPSNKDESYGVAAVIDPTINTEYVPAATWDGLEKVGSEQWAKAREDKGEVYNGFAPRKQIQMSNDDWHALLHNIVVEALVLQKAGRDVDQLWYPRTRSTAKQTTWISVKAEDGKVELLTHGRGQEEREQKILDAIPKELNGPSQHSSFKVGQPPINAKANSDAGWLPLDDGKTKMAIAKRITQLTGRRVPDPILSNATRVQDLLDALKTKDKPQKLAKTEQLQRVDVDMPNVEVHSKRQTVVHKEKRIGRWKVIEAELEARDLPVTGNRWPQSKTLIEPQLSNLGRKLKRMQKA